ncbi:2-oxoacid:acceptor oxidoreductase subunit alpha [Chloroflexota bacterium]
MPVDINFMIGGEAGQGVQSVGHILAKSFSRGGYHVFADQDYESRVRGGHNFYRIRIKDAPTGAIAEHIDILVALNKESLDLHLQELGSEGISLFDSGKITEIESNGNFLGIPAERLAEESAGNKLMSNTVFLGATLGLMEYDIDIVNRVLLEHFGSGKTGEDNIRAAKIGYDFAQENFKGRIKYRLSSNKNIKRMLLNGNEAIALGAITAGCKFMAAYPMTPASSIMEYLAAKAGDADLVMVQAEDEISAINMIIGAGYAGLRSMTATSGGGFCLMVEGLGLAGITETPIVVVNAQRPGPAIGLPTRTEQGDLEFMLYASHGEFPRAVLAPSNVENAFWSTIKAFNLAEKYQLPVILLTDQHLASSYNTVDRFDVSRATINRGVLFSEKETGDYKRYRITESGVSPRAFPLLGKALVIADSDEHDEEGHMIEDADIRTNMMQKRMRKLEGLKSEIAVPEVYGPEKAETTLIGWGSTYGALHEAVDILSGEASIKMVHLTELWPFPVESIANAIDSSRNVYVVENNATGQLAHLIQAETSKRVNGKILKYDGRPFTPADIAREVIKAGI